MFSPSNCFPKEFYQVRVSLWHFLPQYILRRGYVSPSPKTQAWWRLSCGLRVPIQQIHNFHTNLTGTQNGHTSVTRVPLNMALRYFDKNSFTFVVRPKMPQHYFHFFINTRYILRMFLEFSTSHHSESCTYTHTHTHTHTHTYIYIYIYNSQ